MIIVKKWNGISEIVEKATKDLVETEEDDYLFYSAPEGYRLILSLVFNDPPPWRVIIKDIGIPVDKKKKRVLRRGFLSGDEGIIMDRNNPTLELIKVEEIDAEDLKKYIKEERRKARYRVQGRMFP
jgi:hypothetical protein